MQAVPVQTVRRNVRRGDERYATRKQRLQQAGKNHGVGDVGDEELVEADDPVSLGEAAGHDLQRILLIAQRLQLVVYRLHEAVKVNTLLALHGQAFVERIDQVGLAPAHSSPQVKTAYCRSRLFLAQHTAQPCHQSRFRLLGFAEQLVVDALQMANGLFLGRIVDKLRLLQVTAVAFVGCHCGGLILLHCGMAEYFTLSRWGTQAGCALGYHREHTRNQEYPMNRRFPALCLLSLLLCLHGLESSAVGPLPGAAKQLTQGDQNRGAVPAETRPGSVSSQDVEGFVAPLSDVEARRLLIERLREDSARAEARDTTTEEGRFVGVIQALQMRSMAISESFDAMAVAVRDMPHALDYTLRNLTDDEGIVAVAGALAVLALMIGLGLGAEWLLDTRLRDARRRLSASSATAWSARLGLLLLRVALDLLSVAMFAIVAYTVSFAFFERYDPLRLFVTTYLAVIALVRFVHVITLFVLAPARRGNPSAGTR